jgi:hypothetical protein
MANEVERGATGYFRRLLLNGATPFRYRSRVRALLGLPDNGGVQLHYAGPLPVAGFPYVVPRFTGEFEIPEPRAAGSPQAVVQTWEVEPSRPRSAPPTPREQETARFPRHPELPQSPARKAQESLAVVPEHPAHPVGAPPPTTSAVGAGSGAHVVPPLEPPPGGGPNRAAYSVTLPGLRGSREVPLKNAEPRPPEPARSSPGVPASTPAPRVTGPARPADTPPHDVRLESRQEAPPLAMRMTPTTPAAARPLAKTAVPRPLTSASLAAQSPAPVPGPAPAHRAGATPVAMALPGKRPVQVSSPSFEAFVPESTAPPAGLPPILQSSMPSLRRRAAALAELAGRSAPNDYQAQSPQPAPPNPPASAQPPIVVVQPARSESAPAAYWERKHLTHLRTRVLR